MNDDTDVNSDEVNLIIMGGAIVDLGSNQQPDLTGGLDAFNVSILTLAKQFDENGWLDLGYSELMVFTMNELSNDEVDMDVTPTTTGIARYKFDEVDGYLGSSAYGATVLEEAKSGQADFIKIIYPKKQARPQIYLTFGAVKIIPLSILPLLGPIPMETFMDEPTAQALIDRAEMGLAQLAQQAQGITDHRKKRDVSILLDAHLTDELLEGRDLVLVGGPCVNKIVNKLATEEKTLTCDEWQKRTGGMIQILQTEYGKTFIVAGKTGADTVRAATMLQSKDFYENTLAGRDLIYLDMEGNAVLAE